MKNNNIIEFLKWDSDFFGMKVGRVQLSDEPFEKGKFIIEQKNAQYDLIYGVSSAASTPDGFLESLGFYLADCSVTLSMKFDPKKYQNFKYGLCNVLAENDVKFCHEIAEMVAPASRFYKEPAIGQEMTKKMYRRWIDATLDGSFSDHLFVERMDDRIVGINAIKTFGNIGAVTLIGVRDGYHGMGVGRRLWDQSFGHWAKNAPDVNLVRTRFSISNMPAFGFYMAIGLKNVDSVDYIYHYSKNHGDRSRQF